MRKTLNGAKRFLSLTLSLYLSLSRLSMMDVYLQMGLKYGCPVEDIITGLTIQIRGWKSAYYNPSRKAFLGVAPLTLLQTLMQHKRWSEGDFQILLSKYSPARYAHNKISLGLQLAYCCYCFWAPNCLPILYYSIVPSLYLLRGIALFPQVVCMTSLVFSMSFMIYCVFTVPLNVQRQEHLRHTHTKLSVCVYVYIFSSGYN